MNEFLVVIAPYILVEIAVICTLILDVGEGGLSRLPIRHY